MKKAEDKECYSFVPRLYPVFDFETRTKAASPSQSRIADACIVHT
jgi:hypothetical protein